MSPLFVGGVFSSLSGHARSIGAGAGGAALLRAALATDLAPVRDGFDLATPQMASFKCAGPSVNEAWMLGPTALTSSAASRPGAENRR